MTPQHLHRRQAPVRRQRGLTLVELMVALTIGLFLMGAVGIIYVNTATSSRASTLESELNEDANLALELLQQQVRLAGFSNVDAGGERLFPGIAVVGCEHGFQSADANFKAQKCNSSAPGGGEPDADSLAVRYEASLLNSPMVKTAAGVESPANCANEAIESWGAAGEGAKGNMMLADNRYYLKKQADGTPALYCQGRTGANFGTETALIPNIEDMQIQYAITPLPVTDEPIDHQVIGYVKADHTKLGDPTTNGDNWARVAAIRICILARSSRPAPAGDLSVGKAKTGTTDEVVGFGTYFDCDGKQQTKEDGYLRRAYNSTIQLRNVRPALPAEYLEGENPWAFLYEKK